MGAHGEIPLFRFESRMNPTWERTGLDVSSGQDGEKLWSLPRAPICYYSSPQQHAERAIFGLFDARHLSGIVQPAREERAPAAVPARANVSSTVQARSAPFNN